MFCRRRPITRWDRSRCRASTITVQDYYQDFVGGNNQLRYVRGNDTFDLRASLQLNRAISLRVEALNIFNEPKITDMPVEGSIRQYHYYGSKYFFSIRARI